MSTQYANDIPFSASHNQQAFKLIELPPELLALLESDTPPTLTITSTPSTPSTPGHALLTSSSSQTYQLRQKNTSNPIMIIQPSTTGPTEADDAGAFVALPSVCSVAKIEDTIELIVWEGDGGEGEGGGSGSGSGRKVERKVNKWHEKFARGRVGKGNGD